VPSFPPPVWFPDLWCIRTVDVVGAGPSLNTRLLMGPCNSDDIALLCLRPLVLPLLLVSRAPPCLPPGVCSWFCPGSRALPGPAAAPSALYRRPSRPACSSSLRR
jgi:hypothetical protein